MTGHRALGHEQGAGDVAVAVALRDQLGDAPFGRTHALDPDAATEPGRLRPTLGDPARGPERFELPCGRLELGPCEPLAAETAMHDAGSQPRPRPTERVDGGLGSGCRLLEEPDGRDEIAPGARDEAADAGGARQLPLATQPRRAGLPALDVRLGLRDPTRFEERLAVLRAPESHGGLIETAGVGRIFGPFEPGQRPARVTAPELDRREDREVAREEHLVGQR